MESMSFDPMVKIYDETRVFDESSFNAALDFLTERFPPSKFKKLFEPGIGTGRIAIPLAERGYSITGVDISKNMLDVLAYKLSRRQKPLSLVFQRGDVTALPFKDASFDIALVVHLFHLVRHWQKAVSEVLRVLKPRTPLITMSTGTGMEVPSMNDRYRELCAECGQPAKNIGLTGIVDFQEYLKGYGRSIEIIENRWQWTKKILINEAFNDIKSRYYGMTRIVSESVHRKAVNKLELELRKQYGNLDIEVEVPNQIRLFFFKA